MSRTNTGDGVRGFVSHTTSRKSFGVGLRDGSIELLRGATHGLSLATSSLTGSVVRGVSALNIEDDEDEKKSKEGEDDDDDESRERARQSLLRELQVGAELLSRGLIDGASGVVRGRVGLWRSLETVSYGTSTLEHRYKHQYVVHEGMG